MGASSPDGLIFVLDGASGGDGSLASPYGTVADAVAAVTALGSGTIAVYPGVYTSVRVVVPTGVSITVTGCGDETQFRAGGGSRPGIGLRGEGALILSHVTVVQGAPGISVADGIEATLEDVTITGARRVGLQVAGPDTVATVRRLLVEPVHASRGGSVQGWGVSLADGSLTLEDSEIDAQAGYALYGERGRLVATNVVIHGDGARAGGVYAHAMETTVLEAVQLDDVAGEAIHLYEVGAAEVRACVVRTVSASPSYTRWRHGLGDGIVVRSGANPAATALLDGNTVSGAARLGIALDGGGVTLTGNTTSGNGVDDGGTSLWATPATAVTGDAASELDTSTWPLGRDQHPGEGPRGFARPGLR